MGQSSTSNKLKMQTSSKRQQFREEFQKDEHVDGTNKRYRKNKRTEKRTAA